MNVKDLVRPLPGVRQASLLRQRLAYTGSADFCEENYAAGATSVVLQPTGDDPDVDATLALGAEAIALLAR